MNAAFTITEPSKTMQDTLKVLEALVAGSTRSSR
jgi:hypothetical protein